MRKEDIIGFVSIGSILLIGWVVLALTTQSSPSSVPLNEANPLASEITSFATKNPPLNIEEPPRIASSEAPIDVPDESASLNEPPALEPPVPVALPEPIETPPPSQEPERILPSSPLVYVGTLGDGWEQTPWEGVEAVFGDTLSVTTDSDWDRLILRTGVLFSTIPYASITFSIGNSTATGEQLYMAFNDDQYNPIHYVRINDYIEGAIFEAGKKYEIAIPLLDLKASLKDIQDIVVESAEAASFTIGDITFSEEELSSYWEKPAEPAPNTDEDLEEEEDIPELVRASEDPFIFTDEFQNDWRLSSDTWNTIIAIADSPVVSGEHSLEIDYTDVWGSFFIEHPGGLDTTGKRFLSLGVHGGTNGFQRVDLIAYDVSGNELGRTSLVPDGNRMLARAWRNLAVPLYRVNAQDTVIGKLGFQVDKSTSIMYFDDIWLTN